MAGNSFGDLFRVTTFGESHGPALGCVVDGCPPGVVRPKLIYSRSIARPDNRNIRPNAGRPTVKFVRRPRRNGAPIGLLIENTDAKSHDYTEIAEKSAPVTRTYIPSQQAFAIIVAGGDQAPAKQPCASPPEPSRSISSARG